MLTGSDAAGGIGGSGGGPRHIPVLLSEVLSALRPADGETFIDCTFGAGGYTRGILDSANCRVLALDRDPTAIAAAQTLVDSLAGRLVALEAPFSALESVAHGHLAAGEVRSGSDDRAPVPQSSTVPLVDGIVLDIGVSSMQIDDPARGFSFMANGPLDMRMSRDGLSAANIVNSFDEVDIAEIIFRLGEEKRSRTIAKAIARTRETLALETTLQLARLIEKTIGRGRRDDKHPATRTFQALRMYVNDELGQLIAALIASERLLKPGGRLAVVTFHSLEDRIVKRFLARRTGHMPSASRHLPIAMDAGLQPSFRFVNQQPLTPSQPEIERNPRARSAKLRSAERTVAPPFDPEPTADLGLPTIRGGLRR